MHPQIPWELIMDPIGSTEHTLGTGGLEYINQYLYRPYQFFNSIHDTNLNVH